MSHASPRLSDLGQRAYRARIGVMTTTPLAWQE
jgi:hypothetical protein